MVTCKKSWNIVKTTVFGTFLDLQSSLDVVEEGSETIQSRSGSSTCRCRGLLKHNSCVWVASWGSLGGVLEESGDLLEESEACRRASEGDKSMPARMFSRVMAQFLGAFCQKNMYEHLHGNIKYVVICSQA